MPILKSDPEAFEGDEIIIYPDRATLAELFRYPVKFSQHHKDITIQMEIYLRENEKFMKHKNKRAARRAREALLKLFHLVRARRMEMLEIYKNPNFYEHDFRG